ncbi:hypothetical protein AKJ63_01345 [candidate division MSBL1 archaeon SCGC-AAA259D18]|uniref:Uncharacterized protein n=1 Tax=candidate division MSBL1 archaeon SCGC-AAA259D18 TaxID=1698262 RepID=A0A133UBE3_9EURY|nr:hypothetical protein AKJ63_01345 [candidate division MSBL1 archaeon SCGC-AAA259D18]
MQKKGSPNTSDHTIFAGEVVAAHISEGTEKIHTVEGWSRNGARRFQDHVRNQVPISLIILREKSEKITPERIDFRAKVQQQVSKKDPAIEGIPFQPSSLFGTSYHHNNICQKRHPPISQTVIS